MKEPSWGKFDHMVGDERSKMITNFAKEARHPGMTIDLEEKVTELRIELQKFAADDLSKQMQERVVPYVTAKVEQDFKANIEMGISTMTVPSWVEFARMIDHKRSEIITRFREEVQHPKLTINLEQKVKELHNQLENFVKDELTQQMQDRIVPYAMNAAVKIFLDESTMEINETTEPSWKGFDEMVRTNMTTSINKFTLDASHPGAEISVEMEEKLRARLKKYVDNELTRHMKERIVSHFMAEVIEHFTNNIVTIITKMSEPKWKTFDQRIEKERSDMTAQFRLQVQHPEHAINVETYVQELSRQLDECVEPDLFRRMEEKIVPYVEAEVTNFCIKKITEGIEMAQPSWEKFDEMVQRVRSEMIEKFQGEVWHSTLTIDLDMKENELRSKLQEYVKDDAAQQIQCKIVRYAMDEIGEHFLRTVAGDIKKMTEPNWDKFDKIIGMKIESLIAEFETKVQHQLMTINLDEITDELRTQLEKTCYGELTTEMQAKILPDAMIKLQTEFSQRIAKAIDAMQEPLWEAFDDEVCERREESKNKFYSILRTEIMEDLQLTRRKLEHDLQISAAGRMSKQMQIRRAKYAKEVIGGLLEEAIPRLQEGGGKTFPTWNDIAKIKDEILKKLKQKLTIDDERESENFRRIVGDFESVLSNTESQKRWKIFGQRLLATTLGIGAGVGSAFLAPVALFIGLPVGAAVGLAAPQVGMPVYDRFMSAFR